MKERQARSAQHEGKDNHEEQGGTTDDCDAPQLAGHVAIVVDAYVERRVGGLRCRSAAGSKGYHFGAGRPAGA
jgi:hypothetical protein